jgi:hypothetical protein
MQTYEKLLAFALKLDALGHPVGLTIVAELHLHSPHTWPSFTGWEGNANFYHNCVNGQWADKYTVG